MHITDDQFKRAYQSAGVGFICEYIRYFIENKALLEDREEKRKIIEKIFEKSNDTYITGTRTRVNALLKIVQANRICDGLEVILKSKQARERYPEAVLDAENLLQKIKYTY